LKLDKQYKYWEFYYDTDVPEEKERQCVAVTWSDEWQGVELLKWSEEDLIEYLYSEIEYAWKYKLEKINKRKVKYAINELNKIKVELGI
jgi:hypothetical protein